MATPDPLEEAKMRQQELMLQQLDRIEKLALSAIAERDQLTAAKAEAEEDRDRARASMNALYDRLRAAFKDELFIGEDFIDGVVRLLAEARAERDGYKADYLGACQTLAAMHKAATGRGGEGPIRGVVEDVLDLRNERDSLLVQLSGAQLDLARITADRDELLRRWQDLPKHTTQTHL